MTAHGTTGTAIEATKLGAFEYLTKPFEPDELLDLVASSVLSARRMSEPVELGAARENGFAIIGNSRAMQSVYKEIGRIAATPVTVLIRGATGTGKELIARAIYQHSDRGGKPFIAVNCAAIPQTLIESELFGHERGAFTGAHQRRIGRFEQANGGTLFLDEIGDLPIDTQAKLLRVLQERSLQRVGGNELIPVDVRVLAATHRDLEEAIREKEFREDLFFRINVVTLTLPPLQERGEDIPDLVRYFIGRYARELGIDHPSIEPEAIALLQKQPWPGNVRELENAIERAVILATSETIHPAALPDKVRERKSEPLLAERVTPNPPLDAIERAYIMWVLGSEGGNKSRAAEVLGIDPSTLYRKLSRFGLDAA